jgi:type I restriction enzyme S subunit
MRTFTLNNNDIELRLDPHYYLPEFKQLVSTLKKLPYEQLGELVEFSNETWDRAQLHQDTFPYIEISQIDIHSGEIKNVARIPTRIAPSRARMVVKNQDILVSTTRPHRGAISYLKNNFNNYIASTGFAILRKLKRTDLSKEYLFYALRTNLSLQQMLQRSSGGNYPAITSEELKKIIMPVPNSETQGRIINIMLAAYQQKRDKEQEAQELLDSINDYVMQELDIQSPTINKRLTYKLDSNELIHKRLDVEYYQSYYHDFLEQINKSVFAKKRLGEITEFIENGNTPSREEYVEDTNTNPLE